MTDAQLDAAIRRVFAPFPAPSPMVERVTDRGVLLAISVGLILILLSIIIGLFLTPRALPNWAENVFVSIATASALKLGDCVSAVVALSSGRTLDRMGTHLATATPAPNEPQASGKPNDPVHTIDETPPPA